MGVIIVVIAILAPWIIFFIYKTKIKRDLEILNTKINNIIDKNLDVNTDYFSDILPWNKLYPNVSTIEAEGAAPSEQTELVEGIIPAAKWTSQVAQRPLGKDSSSNGAPRMDLERTLASRWLVWIGAIAISLAGIFLTAYAIEQGWLGPAARVTLGILLGLVLVVGGEWIRERPMERAIAAIRPDFVPVSLSAAGIFILYGSFYVGNALYSLYSPPTAFIALALVALAAIAMALLQGWFIAALGILGSYLTPVLIPSDQPSAWILFGYLLAVFSASIALVRYKSWWNLGYAALALSVGWALLWLADGYQATDAIPVGIYIVAVTTIIQLARVGYPATDQPIRQTNEVGMLHPAELLGWTGIFAGAVMAFVFVRIDNYQTVSLATLAVFSVGGLGLSRFQVPFDFAQVATAILVISLFALWHVPNATEPNFYIDPHATITTAIKGIVLPPELGTYTRAAAIFGGIFGLGGFIAIWGAARILPFAAVSAFVPVLLLVIAYWRYLEFGHDPSWAMIALPLAATNVIAAGTVERYRDRGPYRDATGFYAAATTAFISLALTMLLREAWLTVSLSLQLPALAWIYTRLKSVSLRVIAALVAGIVLVRLLLNDNVFVYPLGQAGLFTWIVYGYGIPCVAFIWSARRFAEDRKDYLVSLLEVGAIAFFVLLLSFEIRILVTGSLQAPYDSFLEQSLQSIVWLATGYGLYVRGNELQIGKYPVFAIGGRILLGIAALQVLVLQVFVNSPLQTISQSFENWPSVGNLPIFNILLLAYAVPAGFALALVPVFSERRNALLANISGVIALFLLLVYVSMEVKHWFQGPYMLFRFESDAENYAISVSWLVYALALLSMGIATNSKFLRYGSLAVLLLSVGKVFLLDMAGLVGLYRVASFLGLGLCLIGIGYIYQRFVFKDTARAAARASDGTQSV